MTNLTERLQDFLCLDWIKCFEFQILPCLKWISLSCPQVLYYYLIFTALKQTCEPDTCSNSSEMCLGSLSGPKCVCPDSDDPVTEECDPCELSLHSLLLIRFIVFECQSHTIFSAPRCLIWSISLSVISL